MCDRNGAAYRQHIQQLHKGYTGGGGGYVEVENDVVHGEGQAVLGLYGIVILQRGLSSPFVLKYWKSVLLDIGRPAWGLPDGEDASAYCSSMPSSASIPLKVDAYEPLMKIRQFGGDGLYFVQVKLVRPNMSKGIY